MTAFTFQPTVPAESSISTALGASSAAKFSDPDVGKPVKLGTANNYVLCSSGDEIEGFVTSISPYTVNNGFSHGGVVEEGSFEAVVDTGQTLSVGSAVLAGAQAALGTAGLPVVRAGIAFSQSGTTPFAVTPAKPANFIWRVVRIISGTGVAGDRVLIKRVNC